MGHDTPACGRRQVAKMAQHYQIPSSASPSNALHSQQLAIAYDGGSQFSAEDQHLLGLYPHHLLQRFLLLREPVHSTRHLISLLQKCLCD